MRITVQNRCISGFINAQHAFALFGLLSNSRNRDAPWQTEAFFFKGVDLSRFCDAQAYQVEYHKFANLQLTKTDWF